MGEELYSVPASERAGHRLDSPAPDETLDGS
jgi:hypothetical protein